MTVNDARVKKIMRNTWEADNGPITKGISIDMSLMAQACTELYVAGIANPPMIIIGQMMDSIESRADSPAGPKTEREHPVTI